MINKEAVRTVDCNVPFIPWWNNCVIEREQISETKSGIIIPEDAAKRHSRPRGRLVACGAECEDFVKDYLGKTVWIGRFSGDWMKVWDTEFYLCTEEDILGNEQDTN